MGSKGMKRQQGESGIQVRKHASIWNDIIPVVALSERSIASAGINRHGFKGGRENVWIRNTMEFVLVDNSDSDDASLFFHVQGTAGGRHVLFWSPPYRQPSNPGFGVCHGDSRQAICFGGDQQG